MLLNDTTFSTTTNRKIFSEQIQNLKICTINMRIIQFNTP